MATPDVLDPRQEARLRAASFTYDEVGATVSDEVPDGY